MAKSLSDATLGGRFMGMFVGPPGTSKTISAASWVYADEEKPIYIYDIDGRVRPLLRFLPPSVHDRIKYDTYGPQDFEKLIRHFEKLQDRCPYSAVIMDGLTSLGDMLINYMLSLRAGGGSREGKGKKMGVLEMAGPEDYGGESRGLSMVLDIARSLPCHFILTAHYLIVEYDDPITKKKHIQRMLVTAGKKVGAKVPIYFDEMYYFDIESSMVPNAPPKYTVRTTGGSGFHAKTALPLAPSYDVTIKTPGKDPTLYHLIQESLKEHHLSLEREARVVQL